MTRTVERGSKKRTAPAHRVRIYWAKTSAASARDLKLSEPHRDRLHDRRLAASTHAHCHRT